MSTPLRLLVGALCALALLAVFALYTRAAFVRELADLFWSCF